MLEKVEITQISKKKYFLRNFKSNFIENLPEIFYFQESKLQEISHFVQNPDLYQNTSLIGTDISSHISEIRNFLNQTNSKNASFFYENFLNFSSLFGIFSPENGLFQKVDNGILLIPIKGFLKDATLYSVFKYFVLNKRIDFSYFPESEFFLNIDRNYSKEINIRFIFLGSDDEFEQIYSMDDSFDDLIHKEILLNENIFLDKKENIKKFYSLVKSWEKKDYPSISNSGIEYLLKLHCKFHENGCYFSTDFTYIKRVFLDAICQHSQKKRLTHVEISKTYQSLVSQFSQDKMLYYEELKNKIFLLNLQKEKIGRVNVVSFMEQRNPFEQYGMISEVSARVFSGSGCLINIEKEVNLSGGIYDKGVFILQSYLKGIFEDIENFGLDISLTFEQNYSQIDGDSATVAELIAIFSAISQIPVPANLCITGTFSQYGDALPIGGVNQKVDACCEISNMLCPTEEFRIFIPKSNLNDLFLEQKTLERIKTGKFQIFTFENVMDLVEYIFQKSLKEDFFQILEDKFRLKEKDET